MTLFMPEVLSLEAFKLVFEPSGGRQPDDRRQIERDDGRRADLLSLADTRAISACAESPRRRDRRTASGSAR